MLGLLLLQSIYIVLQWRQNLYTTQRSLIGETGIVREVRLMIYYLVENISNGKISLLEWSFYFLILATPKREVRHEQ